jgi:hypothetical protein
MMTRRCINGQRNTSADDVTVIVAPVTAIRLPLSAGTEKEKNTIQSGNLRNRGDDATKGLGLLKATGGKGNGILTWISVKLTEWHSVSLLLYQ